LDATHELLERALHHLRVGLLSGKTGSLLQELLVKHKICAFHVHSVLRPTGWRKLAQRGTNTAPRYHAIKQRLAVGPARN
jgi:hypothetical protein